MPQVDIVTYYPIINWLFVYLFLFFNILINKLTLNFLNKSKIFVKNNIKFFNFIFLKDFIKIKSL